MSTAPRIVNPSRHTIVMLRHGETQANLEDRGQGHFDAPLTETGKLQAKALATRLANVDFSAVYSSDLQRALDTAKAVIEPHPNLKIQIRTELRETHHGQYENTLWRTICEQDPEFYARWIDLETRIDAKFPGGESGTDTRRRVTVLADEIVTTHQEKNSNMNILIVGHTGSLQALFGHLLNLTTTDQFRFHFDNASVTVVKQEDLTSNGWLVHSFNDTSHLESFNSHE